MYGTVLISDRVKRHSFLRCLPKFKTTQFTSGIGSADLIFPECLPSLAVVILDFSVEERSATSILQHLGEVQRMFKNAYALALNCDHVRWNFLQVNLGGGLLRLLRCSSTEQGWKYIIEIYTALKDVNKLQMQKDYFEREDKKQMEELAARNIVIKSFRKLGIPDSDGQLILDGFPSIKSIISASYDTLSENSPADTLSIEKISNFFAADIVLLTSVEGDKCFLDDGKEKGEE